MMKRKFIYLLLLCFTWIATESQAQQLPLTSHYMVNQYAIDPAFAGTYERAAVMLNYRRDYTGIPDGPNTFRANGFGRIYDNMYLGGSLMSDKVAIFQRFAVNLNYTYRLQMAESQYLSFALWGSFYQSIFSIDEMIGNMNDPVFSDKSDVTRSNFNAGFSLLYNNPYIKIGIGMPLLFRISGNEGNGTTGENIFERAFMIHASNKYRVGTRWQLQPFILYQKTDKEPGVIDISGTAIFNEQFWVTMLYRNSYGSRISLGVGAELIKDFILNYSYEFGASSKSAALGGSHEITLGWRLPAIETGRYAKDPRVRAVNQQTKPRWGDVTPVEYDKRRLNR
ncbi:MAG: PorP/SprF family type IX secretion system membrane protein [Lentimicrobiaceae bacterium]|nr:PorP/SprF family type IX secretion system membrane protein [Lentimicrobiaceae bacterium]